MRRGDHDPAAGSEQTKEFFHGLDHVGDVFDDMCGTNLAEGAVAKRKREMIEVGHDIGTGVRVPIEPDRARKFVDAAADVEYRKLG